MKREDIGKIVENITDEQINRILDLNSNDIGRAKKNFDELEEKYSNASKELETAKGTICNLEKSQNDAKALSDELKSYKEKEERRIQDEKIIADNKALFERFETVATEKPFKHEFVKKGVFDEFKKALSDDSFKGKSDGDIFSAITLDKDYFANQNPAVNMGGFGAGKTLDDNDARAVMGLPPRNKI